MSSAWNNPLRGKRAVVTGAGNGIGRAVATALAEAGAAVALWDRDGDALASTAAAIGDGASTHQLDVTDEAALNAAFADVLALGDVDILVNAAGFLNPNDTVLGVDTAVWDAMYAIHLRTPAILTGLFGSHRIERGGGGKIVNISSSSAYRAAGVKPAYGSLKAGVVQFTKIAAAELGKHDINVNAVVPGLTATDRVVSSGLGNQAMTEGPLANFFGRISTPEDVAFVVVFLCLPGSRQITAQAIHTSAGSVI